MTPKQLHEYLAERTPIDRVPIDWESTGYTSEVFSRWASGPDFPGWKGDLPTEEEVRVIVGLLDAGPGDSLLDVACGYGRHALVMAGQHGLKVTGVDISAALISTARRHAAENGVQAEFHVLDAMDLAWADKFDHAMIALNSFSLFSPNDAGLVLDGMRRALKTGGRIFMDLDNKPFATRYGTSTNDWYLTPAGLTLQETYFHENLSVEVTRDLIASQDSKEVEEFIHIMKLYSRAEICALLEDRGLTVERVCGGWDLSPHDENSPKILLVASKP